MEISMQNVFKVRCIWNVLGKESGANGMDKSLGMDPRYANS